MIGYNFDRLKLSWGKDTDERDIDYDNLISVNFSIMM